MAGRLKWLVGAIALIILGVYAASATVTVSKWVPVMVGADPGMDACGGWGRVKGLDPAGDGFLAVRSGPGTEYSAHARLKNGQSVFLCETRGNWEGIVFTNDKNQDCGTGSPVKKYGPYNGPCPWGWVSRKYIELLAG